jgi:hypothetical protein
MAATGNATAIGAMMMICIGRRLKPTECGGFAELGLSMRRFAWDSLVEGDGFELPVPREIGSVFDAPGGASGASGRPRRAVVTGGPIYPLSNEALLPRGRAVAIDL